MSVRSLVIGTAGILLAACGSSTVGSDTGTEVLVTTSIWADVVENIDCADELQVDVLVPVGGDPHRFEPSLADRGRMESATLIVANGLALEAGLVDTIESVESAGTPVFRFTDHIETIAFATISDHENEDHADDEHEDDEHEDEEHEDEEHGHGADDPHVWFDPTRVATSLPALGDQLVVHAGLDRATVDDCIASYRAELTALDDEIETMVDRVPAAQRTLVTSHDALGYFADRYGFEIAGTVIPTPSGLAETNPAQLEALAELIEAEGVRAIFAETQHSSDDAEALANRVGDVEVVTLFTGTLDEAGSDAATYTGFLRSNAMRITDALR